MCVECNEVFPSSRDHHEHLKGFHHSQEVVCTWCAELKTFLNPSSLKRHMKNSHTALVDQLKLCTTGTAYYFAVQPELYRMTSINVTLPQEEDAQRAMLALKLWSDVLATTDAITLVQRAEEDWRKMGPVNPVIKQERKRNSDIPALPSPKHRRSQEFQPEDFSIGQITLSTAEAHVILTSFIHGRYDLTVVAGETQSRALLRRFSQAKPDSIVTPSSAALPVTDRSTLKVLAQCIGLKHSDIKSATHYPEGTNLFEIPTSTTMGDLDAQELQFGCAGVLPKELVAPSSTDKEGSFPSPVFSGSPAPSVINQVPAAVLAPRPIKITDRQEGEPVLKENPVENILTTGSWPTLCPGRRDWSQGSIRIPLPTSIRWPPQNWEVMDQNQKQAAWLAISTILAAGDEEEGNFPTKDPSVLQEDYSFLALPGSGPVSNPATPLGKSTADVRLATHSMLKRALDKRDHRQVNDLLHSLQAGVGKGPSARKRVLDTVIRARIPLRPLRKPKVTGEKRTYAPTSVHIKKPHVTATVPQYSPTRPGIKE